MALDSLYSRFVQTARLERTKGSILSVVDRVTFYDELDLQIEAGNFRRNARKKFQKKANGARMSFTVRVAWDFPFLR